MAIFIILSIEDAKVIVPKSAFLTRLQSLVILESKSGNHPLQRLGNVIAWSSQA
jgi:hypothetical protein